jgi:hypothetical protein
MASKFIDLTHDEYFTIYRCYKDIVNPKRFDYHEGYAARSEYMEWSKIGLEYYYTNSKGKRFKILDNDKFMQHWMLALIKN